MKSCLTTKALLAACAAALSIGAAFAAETTEAEEKAAAKWAERCDTNKDGMVTKAEMMAQVEKAWGKADAQKKGTLNMKQLAGFLKSFDASNAGGN